MRRKNTLLELIKKNYQTLILDEIHSFVYSEDLLLIGKYHYSTDNIDIDSIEIRTINSVEYELDQVYFNILVYCEYTAASTKCYDWLKLESRLNIETRVFEVINIVNYVKSEYTDPQQYT